MLKRCSYGAINLLLILNFVAGQSNTSESCVQLFEQGVEAYLENRFEECVTNFEKSLDAYHAYRKSLVNCRLKCKNEAELSEPLYHVDIENLAFYEKKVRQTLCLIKCENDSPEINQNYNVNNEIEKLFEDHKPYEYLQLCYFQTKNMMKAASSAFTYLVLHPDDKIMQSNLKHYSELEDVDMDKIVNLEAKDYVYLYVHGADAYENKDWNDVVRYMEESLESYLQAENECRAQCEGPFDHGWFPDFIPSISNHFTVALKCKQKCKQKLSSLNGEIHQDLLPSHYHYLQFAYFKLGNMKAACHAVASYLLFYPDDDAMLSNKKYYSKQPKTREEYFYPREEAVLYVHRNTYESRILKFIMKNFQTVSLETSTKDVNPKLHVAMTESELKGPRRFVMDGVASQTQCRALLEIARLFAVLGDGYDGRRSPHTIMEKFEGITLTRTLFLVYFGLLHPKYLELYMKVTEDAKNHVKEYFKINEELYSSYTHLVCRTTLPDSPENRTDFSHKIHADNCNILKNGTCKRERPAFTWRDYSAIIYLNDDFEGGEFIFSSDMDALSVQSTVRPKCGRMVAFSSGGENLHGVKAVRKGSRCAMGIWFTFDAEKADKDREKAEYVLKNNLNFDKVVEMRRNSITE